MRIRPYIESKDYEYLEKWIDNERIHALWCANLIPYPITKESFRSVLEKNAVDWTGSAYVATENSGEIMGFFCYSVNTDDNSGFLMFVIMDSKVRGKGRGKEMLRLALQYAFDITGVDSVQINVFDENVAAKRCYEKVGFVERHVEKNVFPYKNELWSRCNMVVYKLERMGEFFDNRLEGYEEHQLTCIEAAQDFYPFTASCLPLGQNVRILDLGCGTGLELDYYFKQNPLAQVTGIDLAPGMLAALKNKFAARKITLIQGSYFTVPLGENCYDAAVSVESLHHFTKGEKLSLYCRVHKALKKEGYFLITDYFATSEAEETLHRQEFDRLKSQKGIDDNEYYHYDTPLTVEHETQALLEAGFSSVEVLGRWGATCTLKALV